MKKYLENRVKSIISADSVLNIQFELLDETTNRLGCESHVKGGFCRDLILNILSKEAVKLTDKPVKPFDKEIKDIDVATNADAEKFAKTLYDIAYQRGLNPIEYWNNGDKTDKGKNISVWCVKLFKGVEPIDIVHFRTDSYDPKTGRVEIVDVEDSFSDDFRRDIPWPSIRINDMSLIDYFGVLDRMNRGEFIISTPPKRENGELIPVFNPMIHHETVERILRLFKFVTTPYDRKFAFDFDPEQECFTKVSVYGFMLDPDIVEFYATDRLTDGNLMLREEIYENLIRWRDNGLLANVFNSISSAVSKRPYHFIQFLHDFRILDILFDSNHDVDVLLYKTRIIERSLQGQRLAKPYSILGFGCKDFSKLQKIMGLFSIDKTSIRLAKVFSDDILLDDDMDVLDWNERTREIISNVYSANRSSYELELREFYSIVAGHIGVDIDEIPRQQFRNYYDEMRKRSIFRPILIDYLLAKKLERENMLDFYQLKEIEEKLVECLEARLNGNNYLEYPKIQHMVESNCLNLTKTKTKNELKKLRKTIYDHKTVIGNRVDSDENIFALAKIEAKTLWNVTFRL